MAATDKITNWIRKNRFWASVFLLTFSAGLMVHFYMFSNKLYNYFEMNNILTPMAMDKGDTLAMGRWFLPVVSRLSSVYSMPAVNGLICLICLSLVSCMLVDVLQIRKILPAALCGALAVSFPGVASYLSYGVNADVFCAALLMSAAAGWVLYRADCSARGMAGCAVLLCFCIGTYQPFMSVTIAVIFCMLFLDVWSEGKGFASVCKKALRCLIALAAGFILYYLVLKIVTGVSGIRVGDYHGVNDMTSFTVKGIAKGGVYTYLYFFGYLFTLEFANFAWVIVFDIAAAAVFLFYTVWGYRKIPKEKREKGSAACLALLIVFLPLGVNATPFLMADRVGNGVDRYMMFSIMLLFLLLIKMTDAMGKCGRGRLLDTAAQWLSLAAVIAVIWGNYYMCNQGYFRAEAMTKSTESLLNRLAYRIESAENWSPRMPVFLANCEALFNENCDTEIAYFEELRRVEGTQIKPWYNYGAVVKYMRVYLNFPIREITQEAQERILSSAEFAQMGIYPREDSMRMIDGALVVKFGENEEAAQEN